MSVIDAAKRRFAAVRERSARLDHAVRMQQHYSATGASQQAGAVTYFGFLSVFPILALAFFVVGYVAKVYPAAQTDLLKALDQVLPHLVSTQPHPGQISLTTFQHSANTVGVIGIVGVLYSGLGWIDSLRTALAGVFEIPKGESPNMIVGKLLDLATMAVLGVVLLGSVAVTGVVRGLSSRILDWVGVGVGTDWLLWLLALALGLAADAVLFFTMFKLLARPHTASRHLWAGAVLGGVGFEVLKNLAVFLLGSAKGQPAFQVFGISLILLVWINYFSRVTLYAASWAYTAEPDRVPDPKPDPKPEAVAPAGQAAGQAVVPADRSPRPSLGAFGAGVAVALAGILGWRELRRRP